MTSIVSDIVTTNISSHCFSNWLFHLKMLFPENECLVGTSYAFVSALLCRILTRNIWNVCSFLDIPLRRHRKNEGTNWFAKRIKWLIVLQLRDINTGNIKQLQHIRKQAALVLSYLLRLRDHCDSRYYFMCGNTLQLLQYFYIYALFQLSILSPLFTLILACLLLNIFVMFLLIRMR